MILQASLDTVPSKLAQDLYSDVFRHDYAGTGFGLIQFDTGVASKPFRQFMISMQLEFHQLVRSLRGLRLRFQSLIRFDQQTTTKFHLDGGPEESILMLGYEPTEIKSSVALADYSRAASDLGLTPQQFMDQHNPMFVAGEKLLQPYVHRVNAFDESRFQILFINNSRLPREAGGLHSLGVLHQATILNPDPVKSRVINSTMMAVVSSDAPDAVSAAEISEFAITDAVARRNYAT